MSWPLPPSLSRNPQRKVRTCLFLLQKLQPLPQSLWFCSSGLSAAWQGGYYIIISAVIKYELHSMDPEENIFVIFNLFSRVVLLPRDMEDKREAFLY